MKLFYLQFDEGYVLVCDTRSYLCTLNILWVPDNQSLLVDLPHSPFSAIAFCSPLKGTQMKSLKEEVTLLYSSLEDCGELLSCKVPPSGGHNNTGVYSTKYTYYRFSILLTLVHISALSGIPPECSNCFILTASTTRIDNKRPYYSALAVTGHKCLWPIGQRKSQVNSHNDYITSQYTYIQMNLS